MKKSILFLFAILLVATSVIQAQHIRARLNFPISLTITPAGPAPFRGAVWVGPEWVWKNGNYIHSPGYWAKPIRKNGVWVPGHWKHTRKGYFWKPGHWK